jgi:hypothetical protein
MSFDLAEFVFCCSSLPSKKEVEVFRTMPSMGSGDRDLALSCLTQGLVTRYLRTSLFSEICYAIDLAKEVISRTDTNDQRLGRRLVDISRAYLHQYSKGGKGCLQLALESAERAFQVTSPDQVDRSRALNARANAFGTRYLDEEYDDDIDQAIHEMESALNPTLYPLDDQDKLLFLQDFAIYLGYRYHSDRAASHEYLNSAIQATQHAVHGMSPRNPGRGNALHTLGVLFGERAKHTAMIGDIYQAIHAGRKALESTPPTGADRAFVLRGLAYHLRLRYECMGSKDDLQEALDLERQASDQAIKVHREALKSTPPTGADRAFVLRQLACELRLRYEFESSKDYLQEALDIARQAIHAIPQDHDLYPRCLALHGEIRKLCRE